MLACKPDKFPDALVCAECKERVARQACYECDMPFCDSCFLSLHDGHHGMAFHFSIQIDYKAMDSRAWMCGHCEVRPTRTFCCDCNEGYCTPCTMEEHARGTRATHTAFIPIHPHSGEFVVTPEVVEAVGPAQIDLAALMETKKTLMASARTVTGVDPNWKTTNRLAWEASDEAKRLAAEAAEAARVSALLEEHRATVEEIFAAFDLDGNGTIDADEMDTVLRKEICAPLKKSEVRAMYKELDTDGDGAIDFDEFHRWYTLNILAPGLLDSRTLTKAQLRVARSVGRLKGSLAQWVQEKMPKKAHKKVPGYDALVIRDADTDEIYHQDVARVKPKFWWWAREMYGLDKDLGPSVDEQRDFTVNELEAFDMLFKPQWNSGSLPVKFYHDGRRFYSKGKFWRQTWDRHEDHFTWTNEANGFSTHVNPDPSTAELSARRAKDAAANAGAAGSAVKQGFKKAGRLALRGAGAMGRGALTGAGIVGKKIASIGLPEDVRRLMNLGFPRQIAKRAVARAPNLEDGPSPPALVDRQIQEATMLQVELDDKRAERAARLRDEPHIGMVIQKHAVILGRGIIDLIRQRKRENLTEEERKANQLAALRRDLYGEDGLPNEYIDLDSSDDEDAFGNVRE
jgi:hypothetical protein